MAVPYDPGVLMYLSDKAKLDEAENAYADGKDQSSHRTSEGTGYLQENSRTIIAPTANQLNHAIALSYDVATVTA